MKHIRKSINKFSLANRVTAIYLIFGILWIMLSDKLLSLVISDIGIMSFIQTIKGNLYVVMTGVLLWSLIVMGQKEIHQLHEETLSSEAKYRSYFEQGFVAILLLDKTMKIVDANTKAQHIFGFSKQALAAMGLDALLPKEADHISQAFSKEDLKGKVIELTIIGQTGHRTHALMSLSKILDEHGAFKNYAAFIQEINEQKRYQDALVALNNQLEKRVEDRTTAFEKANLELKKALVDQEQMSSQLERSNQSLRDTVFHLNKMQDRLVQTERMTALGNLVASLTHEISTPVGSAMTAGSYIKEQTSAINGKFETGELTKTAFQEYVDNLEESTEIINRNLSHAAELMNNFKQMAADQTQMEIRCVNLEALVEESLLSLKPVLKRKQIEYDIDIDPQLVISTIPGYLTQILNNLLTNTFKHGFKNRQQGKIAISIKENKGHIELVYEDNGCGIGEENRQDVFKPFFSTISRHSRDGLSGIGLGLYIVKKIIEENLKGTIGLESEKDLYTRFTIGFEAKNCSADQ